MCQDHVSVIGTGFFIRGTNERDANPVDERGNAADVRRNHPLSGGGKACVRLRD